MRNATLHGLLEQLAEQVSVCLAQEAAGGAEIPFEIVEEKRKGSAPLYCYRPLTGEFIAGRKEALAALDTWAPAARALEEQDGIDNYLRELGQRRPPRDRRERAERALHAFLERAFGDTDDFALDPERFAAAYRDLEAIVYQGRRLTTVLAPVLGLEIESPEIELGGGLALIRGEELADAPEDAVWPRADGDPAVLAVLTVTDDQGHSPVTLARMRFRRLLSALRLFEAGGFALGPLAWARAEGGDWQAAPLEATGRARGMTMIVGPQEDELRAFCNLVARRAPKAGEVAWALRRFELACERTVPFEALSDHLLALRALLEPEGAASGRLGQRLAALCALPEHRAALAERAAATAALERAYITGLARPGPDTDLMVEELAGHLRALLRDVLCGHLDPDLRAVADDLLAEAAELLGERDAAEVEA